MQSDYDLCVIGSGINGAGIARDAAGRGLSVLLVEAQDLASATSSSSTKLIHGGLRYLEQYEFRLVREALMERAALLQAAPHIIRPLEFVLPHDSHIRPLWMIRAGLFLYDHLGGRKKLPKSKILQFKHHPYGGPIKASYTQGFSYTDCWVEDSRLVVLNAMDAKMRGADILTRTACTHIKVRKSKQAWMLKMHNINTGDDFQVTASTIVNAAGPWVRGILEVSDLADNLHHAPHVRLVKGSHIVVPKLFEGDQAYILQQPDKRVVFAIPYERDYTLIGTTEVEYEGDPTEVAIDESEKEYLCNAINASFENQISPDNIVWAYSGVRPLVEDGEETASEVTRDYTLHMDDTLGPPILSVFGGKITTYRKLSEHVVSMIIKYIGLHKKPWTQGVPLPGGEIMRKNFDAFLAEQQQNFPRIPKSLVLRCARSYGTRLHEILKAAQGIEDLGEHYGDDLYEAEVRYLIDHEFAQDADDILWRRSKLGLHVQPSTVKALEKALPKLLQEEGAHERTGTSSH